MVTTDIVATCIPESYHSIRIFSSILALLLGTTSVMGENANLSDAIMRLKGMSINELMDVSVTTASRRPQKYSDAAAALFVISKDDIRRSGASSLPELLRMVPGLQVARIDANKWAVSARGFNGRYANKLLVQQDGRTLYTPLYSGVYWDAQDPLLEDIERIEVIRGPGATLWGANAVNGVINIITHSANDTESGLLTLQVGDEEKVSLAARYGAAFSDDSSFRFYAKGFDRDGGLLFSRNEATDNWSGQRIGFRTDMDISQVDKLTVQGDLYDGESGAMVAEGPALRVVEMNNSGGNLLARWSRRLASDAGIELQFYYDHTQRTSWSLSEDRDTYNLDIQHHFTLADNHYLVWGAGYLLTKDDIVDVPGGTFTFEPKQRDLATFNAFIQDDIAFADDNLHLIIGTKLEHNDYTGWELQPNIRALWNATTDTTLWAAVSRAVRTPSRVDSDVTIAVGPVVVSGNPDMQSERLTAFEIGLRLQPLDTLSLDLATFYNDYDRLQTFELTGSSFPPPIHQVVDNKMKGSSYGLELATNWNVSRNWRMKVAYSWFELDLELEDDSTDRLSPELWDRAPRHQISLRSLLDLPHDLELDSSMYYVDDLPNTEIPSYLRLDLRLGWFPVRDLELSLIGKNLLDDSHPEFTEFSGNSPGQGLVSTQVERSFLVQARWSF